MLQSLVIRDVVLIEELDLEFEQGLGVLTGETGAGKSILLDSLGLALGERAETALIRKGAEKAQVIASFQLPSAHEAFKLLRDQDIETQDDQILLRRVLTDQGRNKCYVNDQPVSQSFAKTLAALLVEVHGQFDKLLDVKSHKEAIDSYAGLNFQSVGQAYQAWQDAKLKYEGAVVTFENIKDRESFLRLSVEELEKLKPQPAEEETLIQERAKVAHRAKISEAASTADQSLSHEGVVTHLVHAQRAVQKVEDCFPEKITPLIETLDRALIEVEEAGASVNDLLQEVQGESASLESIEDRLHELRAMARKHNVPVEGLVELFARYSLELCQIDQGEDLLDDLKSNVLLVREVYEKEAKKISDQRRETAKFLEQAMANELVPLKLGQAKFHVEIAQLDEDRWGPEGWDRIQFCVATNPGSPSGPLNKIASGGELSRLMLALKVVLAQTSAIPTLIFDEIDTGTGGAVAAAIGERLKKLSTEIQVLAITHSPQVAAVADHHLQVLKTVNEGKTTTHVIELANDQRLEEVARMLSGSEITSEARAQAKQLMRVS